MKTGCQFNNPYNNLIHALQRKGRTFSKTNPFGIQKPNDGETVVFFNGYTKQFEVDEIQSLRGFLILFKILVNLGVSRNSGRYNGVRMLFWEDIKITNNTVADYILYVIDKFTIILINSNVVGLLTDPRFTQINSFCKVMDLLYVWKL